jgi:DNA polymerase III subunit chi
MRVDFYHLTAMPLERVLPRIGERLIGEGERLLVVASPEQLRRLDTELWSYARDGFLPHGLAPGANAGRQPILLADRVDAANGARNVALADGEWREEALAFQRIFYFFDNDHLPAARATWRSLKAKPDAEQHYWKQDDSGKWTEGP